MSKILKRTIQNPPFWKNLSTGVRGIPREALPKESKQLMIFLKEKKNGELCTYSKQWYSIFKGRTYNTKILTSRSLPYPFGFLIKNRTWIFSKNKEWLSKNI